MTAKDKLIKRILRKGYAISVDDGDDLLVHKSRDPKAISAAMRGKDLLWLRDRKDYKFGWLQVDSNKGIILDYSLRDPRLADLVAEEFI